MKLAGTEMQVETDGHGFAAAAARRGAAVTLFERKATLLHLQAGCTTRRVHPHIFDWPVEGSEALDAGLPVLDWKAGSVAEVARDVLHKWDAEAVHIEVRRNTTVKAIKGTNVVFDPPERDVDTRSFGLVILCVGFGLEPGHSYWRIDDLEQPVPDDTIQRYVISGLGDGAIADVLRLRLGDGHRPFEDWLSSEWIPRVPRSLRAEITRVEREARLLSGEEATEHFAAKYGSIFALGVDDLLASLRSRLRRDCEVLWVGPSRHPFVLGATPLNRFAIAALRALPDTHLTFAPGKVDNVEAGPVLKRMGGAVPEPLGDRKWIPRHGPDRRFLRELIGKSAIDLIEHGVNGLGLDAPRTRLWPDGYFDPLTPQTRTLTPRPPSHAELRPAFAVVDSSVAVVIEERSELTEDAAMRTSAGYGVLATATRGEADALAAQLFEAFAAAARSGGAGKERTFFIFELRLPVDGATIVYGDQLPTSKLREEVIEEARGNNASLVAVVDKLDFGDKTFEVYCILVSALDRVTLLRRVEEGS